MEVYNTRTTFIVSEVFTEKRHGGFRWLVRVIGGKLVKQNFEVLFLLKTLNILRKLFGERYEF
jgi:hypothetical protein